MKRDLYTKIYFDCKSKLRNEKYANITDEELNELAEKSGLNSLSTYKTSTSDQCDIRLENLLRNLLNQNYNYILNLEIFINLKKGISYKERKNIYLKIVSIIEQTIMDECVNQKLANVDINKLMHCDDFEFDMFIKSTELKEKDDILNSFKNSNEKFMKENLRLQFKNKFKINNGLINDEKLELFFKEKLDELRDFFKNSLTEENYTRISNYKGDGEREIINIPHIEDNFNYILRFVRRE